MKAVAGDLPADDGSWCFEVKWDGMRVLARVGGEGLVLRNARGADVTGTFPELGSVVDAVGGRPCLLDGEVVALGADGSPSFEMLQQRIHVTDRRVAHERASSRPVVYMAFDLLELDGEAVWRLPYLQRRELLGQLVVGGPSVQVPTSFPHGGADLLEAARRNGLEGVVAKRGDAPYEPGGRSASWRKVKVRNTQEFVVAGWLGGTGARRGTIGSLVLGCRRAGTLTWAGNVGTGFTDRELDCLRELLARLAIDTCPFDERPSPPTGTQARWIRPEVVVQVAFGEWTSAGRLRHPSYLGRRDDKDVLDVTCDP